MVRVLTEVLGPVMVPGPAVTSQVTEPILVPFSKASISSVVWTSLIAPPAGFTTFPTIVTAVDGTTPVLLGSSGTDVTVKLCWSGGVELGGHPHQAVAGEQDTRFHRLETADPPRDRRTEPIRRTVTPQTKIDHDTLPEVASRRQHRGTRGSVIASS